MSVRGSTSNAIPADHLASLLNASLNASLVLRFANDELTIVGGNEAWATLCGTGIRDLMRRSAGICLSAELVEAVERMVRDGLPEQPVELPPSDHYVAGSQRVDVALVGTAPDQTQQFVLLHAEPSSSAGSATHQFVLQSLGEGVLVFDGEFQVAYANGAADKLLGMRPGEPVGASVQNLFTGESFERVRKQLGERLSTPVRLTLTDRSGRQVPVQATLNTVDGVDGHAVMSLHDMTAQHEHEQQLAVQSAVDELTGLANRQTFAEHIVEVAQTGREIELTVAFLDLDNFKTINDALGHEQGDIVLQTIARRLTNAIGSHGLVSRFGGDEFVVATHADPGTGHAELTYLLGLALAEPVELGGKEFTITVSTGVVTTTDPAIMRADSLLKAADIAMYEAKRRGKNCVAIYDESLEHRATARIEIESDLRRALERDEFALHYQPIMDVISGRPVGSEALLRWNHPERGMVPPDQFIPIAEQTGLIVPLGAWVLDTAIDQTAHWNKNRLTRRALGVSVNISGLQLDDPEFEQRVHASLSRTGFDPARLTLEVTESTLMSDTDETMQILTRLRELGIRIAIDDFGTGYSSLAYLKQLPANALKVDKAFIDGLGLNPEDTSLVTGIIGLASALNLEIVAEGVETKRQLKELRRLGCEYSQGYFHSKPLPPTDFEEWLGDGPEPPPDQDVARQESTLASRLSALTGERRAGNDEAEPRHQPEPREPAPLFDQNTRAIG